MADPNRLSLYRAVTVPEFRRMALSRLLDLVRAFRRRAESMTRQFQARESVTLFRFQQLDELVEAVKAEVGQWATAAMSDNIYPDSRLGGKRVPQSEVVKHLAGPRLVIERVSDGDHGGLQLLAAFNDLLGVEARYGGAVDNVHSESCRMMADDSHVYFYVSDAGLKEIESPAEVDRHGDPAGELERTDWKDGVDATRFVAAVGKMLQRIRRDMKRRPNPAEAAAARAAYEVLGRGTSVGIPYRPLGVPGFKVVQTLLFLTDPGEGHLQVTCHEHRLLAGGGTAVHIEHIDRDETRDKDTQVIEAYRLPAPINVAKVRLHIGPDAPCTAFIGRPVFENRVPCDHTSESLHSHYRLDRLKAAHMTASCCTAMFLNGVSECKVAIERMTASDAIDFMRAVAGNVFRDRHRQFLSAAFNIFTPIFDDRSAPGGLVTDAEKLCKLGTQLAEAGGFDKVTWDGAKPNQFPSLPILSRGEHPELEHGFWVRTVHEAHLRGLTTYVSAGLEPQHMPRAVYAGLDGVGIGVKLHYFDRVTGRTGEFDPTVMEAVLETARRAQETTLGRSAKMLARLARLKYENILSADDDGRRVRLLDELAGVTLPAGVLEKAPEQEKQKLIAELLRLGTESDAARDAEQILGELAHLAEDILPNDQPLASPIRGQVVRLEHHLTSMTGGMESSEEMKNLTKRLIQLRGELCQADRVAMGEFLPEIEH